MITHVVGLMFSADKQYMLLMRDNKPEEKNVLLHGIEGEYQVEDISPVETMVRVCKQKIGIETVIDDWSLFTDIRYKDTEVAVFKTSSEVIYKGKSTNPRLDDLLIYSTLKALTNPTINLTFNLYWLIPLALDVEVRSVDVWSTK